MDLNDPNDPYVRNMEQARAQGVREWLTLKSVPTWLLAVGFALLALTTQLPLFEIEIIGRTSTVYGLGVDRPPAGEGDAYVLWPYQSKRTSLALLWLGMSLMLHMMRLYYSQGRAHHPGRQRLFALLAALTSALFPTVCWGVAYLVARSYEDEVDAAATLAPTLGLVVPVVAALVVAPVALRELSVWMMPRR